MGGDSYVFHLGGEYYLNEKATLRTGYIYGKSPIPDDTLVPVLGAILEHTISFGLGYKWESWELNAAYQHSFNHSQSTDTSDILGDDYNNSQNELYANSLFLTLSYHF